VKREAVYCDALNVLLFRETEDCYCSGGFQTVPVRLSDTVGWMQGRNLRSDDIRLMGNCLGRAAGERS
jgi:hypothetical protein